MDSAKKANSPQAKKLPAEPKIEGEGSYSATKVYDDATRAFISKGTVDAAAAEAKRAIDSSEDLALTKAEADAKAHAAPGERPSRTSSSIKSMG